MTSPYLEKPKRELGQALKDCGINRSDVGFDIQQPKSSDSANLPGANRKSASAWVIAAFALLIVSATIIMATTHSGQQVAEEPNADEVINIAPAAGGSQQ
ncbi:MAG: hypothetical protein P1V34_08205 [Alphaproteobacteria bacterium]|nr:hypothetical protein [Alphaproteobacteria bacterium]